MIRRNTPKIKIKTLAVSSVAALVSGGLFLTMTGLVANDDVPIIDYKTLSFVEVTFRPIDRPPIIDKIKVEIPPIIDKIKVEIPPKVIDPPIVKKQPRPLKPGEKPSGFHAPSPKPPVADTGDRLNLGQADGDMMILAGFPPQYPRRQLENNTEGYVVISLTVNADGQVKDPYVIDAEPSGVFNKSALIAISKFRYKPRVINGQAYPVFNVRYKMIFEIEK